MTQAAANDDRRFSVYARHAGPHHARIIHEPTYEAAAVAYVEDLAITPDEGEQIRVIVRDLASHHEHCFVVDLESGETASCG
jgi:molecular chaperone DnaK (HSP70)